MNFQVVSTYFSQCNFDGRKIHVVSTYFFRCNFDGRKIPLVFTYLIQCNFFRRNIHGVSTYFFRRNFDGRIINFVCKYFFSTKFRWIRRRCSKVVSWWKHSREFSFVSNFKKLTFARSFSLNFLSKCPWCSTVLLKFESYNLQHCKKNCCKLVFWVFTEQLNYQIIFGAYIAMELLL